MTTSPKLGIELLDVGQSQKEVSVNEAMLRMETMHAGVLQYLLNTPPGSPANGDAYILGASPTGAWAGKAYQLAFYIGGSGWRFIAPVSGMVVWVVADLKRVVYYSSAWHDLPDWPYAQVMSKNLLINSQFNVWQRGTSLTPNDNVYSADRWRFLAETNGSATVAQDVNNAPTGYDSAVSLTVAIANQKFGILQWIEGNLCTRARNNNVTLSLKLAVAGSTLNNTRIGIVQFTGTKDSVSADPISAWNAAGTLPTLATNYSFVASSAALTTSSSYATYTLSGTVSGSMTNLGVLIWNDDKTTTVTTDILRISGVQLEVADNATAYEYRSLPDEQRLCERYFCRVYQTLAGVASSSTNLFQRVLFPTPMRVAPTGGLVGLMKFSDDVASDFDQVGSSMVYTNLNVNGGRAYYMGMSGLTSGKMYAGIANSNYLIFDAEL